MNQAGGSGVGVGGADGLPQHQPMQDVVGLDGIDAQFVMLRNSMREKIFEYVGRRKNVSADWLRRLPELARRLEVILFTKFSDKNDYYNMMKGPFEPQLIYAIRTLSAQNQQNQQTSGQITSSSSHGTIIPTPGMTQGSSGNASLPYVTDNNALPSSGEAMVPESANMGTSMQGQVFPSASHGHAMTAQGAYGAAPAIGLPGVPPGFGAPGAFSPGQGHDAPFPGAYSPPPANNWDQQSLANIFSTMTLIPRPPSGT